MSSALAILNPSGQAPQKVPAPISVVGIDLGTTNSTVAEIVWKPNEDLKVRCLKLDQETASDLYTHNLVPSAVALFNGREWIGEGAKRLHTPRPGVRIGVAEESVPRVQERHRSQTHLPQSSGSDAIYS